MTSTALVHAVLAAPRSVSVVRYRCTMVWSLLYVTRLAKKPPSNTTQKVGSTRLILKSRMLNLSYAEAVVTKEKTSPSRLNAIMMSERIVPPINTKT